MTKFLNISTDNTLGGNAPSDELVVSQKAIKEYVDGQAGGGGYHPDLFTWQWADHELNDVQWLRADTFSWQSGAVYQAAYQHLADDYNNTGEHLYGWSTDTFSKTPYPSVGDVLYRSDGTEWSTVAFVARNYSYIIRSDGVAKLNRNTSIDTVLYETHTETIAGVTITYYQAADGHKLVLPDQESNVTAIYAATGVAWYYIIDTTNQQFKLPRAKHNKYTQSLSVIGTGKVLGLTNGTDTFALNSGATFARLTIGYNAGQNVANSGGYDAGYNVNWKIGVSQDPAYSGLTTTSIEQDTDQYKYLYFYVGNFTQTALENTAGINTELFNDKVDIGHDVIEFQAPTAANNYTWYRKYRDGWVEQGGYGEKGQTITLPVEMANANYGVLAGFCVTGSDNISYGINADSKTTTSFRIRTESSVSTNEAYWEVKGIAAN